MNVRNAVANTLALQRLSENTPAWSLLRASTAPAVVAVLQSLFGSDNRSLPGSDLMLAVDSTLIDIREQTGLELPKSAEAYVNDWVKAGYLVRRSPQGSREEFYELSTDAHVALEYLNQLASPQRTVTKSRLSTLYMNLRELAAETDPDEDAAIRRLEQQRDAIQSRIDRIRGGEIEVISDRQALERTREILSLVSDLPADFARMRSDVEAVDRTLRESILEEKLNAGEVLDNVFRGVDLISESDAGQAFNGFYELFLDQEHSINFNATLDAVLSRDFVDQLKPEERNQLRLIMDNLDGASGQVHDSMTSLSRSMRRFVQSREAEAQQALTSAINDAQQKALRLARQGLNPRTATGVELELTSRTFQSVSTWSLHDPMDYKIDTEMSVNEPAEIDFAAMRQRIRESEIDWQELQTAINDVVATKGIASIGNVLTAHPATQGLASVVGLIKLAHRHGTRGDGTEVLRWDSPSGRKLQSRYERYEFTREV